MGNNSISHKIDAYAQANLKALKQEEAKTGRKMTKFDIAQYMLQHGKLNKNEYANWMNTSEGFNAQAMTQAQKTALRQGSVWGFAGYGGGQESYLDSMTSFAQKNPVKKQNAISGHQMKLNETVAERKKKAAEINNYLKNERLLNHKKAEAEQKFKAQVDSAKISEEDKDKNPIELTKEIAESNEEYDITDVKKHPVASILTAPLRGVAYAVAAPISLLTSCEPPEQKIVQNVHEDITVHRTVEKNEIKEKLNYTNNAKSNLKKEIDKIPSSRNGIKEYIKNNSIELNEQTINEIKVMMYDNAPVAKIRQRIIDELNYRIAELDNYTKELNEDLAKCE